MSDAKLANTDSTTAASAASTTTMTTLLPVDASSAEQVAQAIVAKDAGNALFRSGDFAGAVEKFSDAIRLNPLDEKMFCNRSLAFSSMKDYLNSNADAKKAISLNKRYTKAHFRLIKNFIETNRLRDARVN